MAKQYDRIPAFVDGDEGLIHAVIETPGGIRHKFAYEPKYRIMRLRLTLAEGLTWPYDYGFVPQTLGDDGDALDILVLNDTPVVSGCLIEARLIGGFLLSKNGEENNRLLACPKPTRGTAQRSDAYEDISDVPDELLRGVERFLVEYSEEEGNEIELKGRCTREQAFERIRIGHAKYTKAQR